MDSLEGAASAARAGGPAGEIRVRESLEAALAAAGVVVDVVTSDAEMLARVGPNGALPHALLILDEWTLLAPGGAARPWLRGREADTFLLAFFGVESATLGGFSVPPAHVLTAFPEALGEGSTFLGFAVPPRWAPRDGQCAAARAALGEPSAALEAACGPEAAAAAAAARAPPLPNKTAAREGVLWGKKREYFAGRAEWLAAAAALAPMWGAHALPGVVPPERATGPLDAAAWGALLARASFFLGVGDPLAGPSAVDAIGAGAVYIDPFFAHVPGVRPELARWGSQHPFLSRAVGAPYACGARLDSSVELAACVRRALELDLPPLVPPELTPAAHAARVRAIFARWIQ